MSFKFEIYNGEVLQDLTIVKPDVYTEKRGTIWTSYLASELDNLVPHPFNHDKFSVSKHNVLRGIHGDHKSWKLISCPIGEIYVAIVDMRKGSKTYLNNETFILNDDNRLQILIPPGFGNSFYVCSEQALYHYKLAYEGDYIDANEQFTVSWDDNRLNIEWPCDNPILSERDGR